MRGDGIHHDAEGEDMRAHDEDDEDELPRAEDFAADPSKEDIAGIAHGVDLWVEEFELTDHVAGVGGEGAETDEENQTGDQTEG